MKLTPNQQKEFSYINQDFIYLLPFLVSKKLCVFIIPIKWDIPR